jgi:hypothetical protein
MLFDPTKLPEREWLKLSEVVNFLALGEALDATDHGSGRPNLSCRNRIDLIGAPERIRTSDPQIRSLVLYPAELPVR